MHPASTSVENPVDECLSPEQLMVANIEGLMKARGISRTELSKRLNDLGFTAWRHEKTIRNLFDGKRSIRVNELFGFAAVLNTSTLALTALDTLRAIYGRPIPELICLGSSQVGRFQYMALWVGTSAGTEIPTDHINWAAWEPGRKPWWVNTIQQQKGVLIQMYENHGWELPANADELTSEQLSAMGKRLIDTIKGLDE